MARLLLIVALLIASTSAALAQPVAAAKAEAQRPVVVPYLYGLTRPDAEAEARGAGLTPRFSGPSSNVATVADQSLKAQTYAARGSVITLRLAPASPLTTTPDLVGRPKAEATAAAAAVGLTPAFYGATAGLVASQLPPPGRRVAKGSYLQLEVRASPVPKLASQAPPTGQPAPIATKPQPKSVTSVLVPNVLGETRTDARESLAAVGLTGTFIGDYGAVARVSDQAPSPGATVASGAQISLTLVNGPSSLIEPDPIIPKYPSPWLDWLVGAGVLAAAVAAGVWIGRQWRPRPPRPTPNPLVSYVVTQSAGHPTLRMVGKPASSARTLTPGPGTNGESR
jgi:beta-lactam-binding protein with PASTA domain